MLRRTFDVIRDAVVGLCMSAMVRLTIELQQVRHAFLL